MRVVALVVAAALLAAAGCSAGAEPVAAGSPYDPASAVAVR